MGVYWRGYRRNMLRKARIVFLWAPYPNKEHLYSKNLIRAEKIG